MFGVSKSGYYSWKGRKETNEERRKRLRQEFEDYSSKFKEIIAKIGYIPGKRAFRDYMWRDYEIHISVKRCAKIMRRMNITANKPKKDAYKHQATHDHPAAAPENKVLQDFYQGPRKVILTDITYLYFGSLRTPFYLCVFKDAYTKEILGYAVQTHMTVGLVQEAYGMMKRMYGNQLKKAVPYIHSDQGSQYLSTTFTELLKDDGFIQSVSGRGNSQDNAPMESFFGRMKCRILDLVALCPNFDTARRLVIGYIETYNTKMYQHELACLTPQEFYQYCTTGIYPLDNYYGVKATELRSVEDLVEDRRAAAAKRAEKIRRANAAKRAASPEDKSPLQVLARDQRILHSQIKKWKEQKEMTDKQVDFLEAVLEKTKTAGRFFASLAKEELEKFKDLTIWKNYPELDYVFDMRNMF